MTMDSNKVADEVMRLADANRSFFEILDAMIAKIRQITGMPQAGIPDTVTEQDLARLRERMEAFLPQYEAIYRRLLVKYVGNEDLASCADALKAGPVRRYFDATHQMRAEWTEELQQLGARMVMLTLG